MKKIIALLLVAISVFAFSGCNKNTAKGVELITESIAISETNLYEEIKNQKYNGLPLSIEERKTAGAMEGTVNNLAITDDNNKSVGLFMVVVFKTSDIGSNTKVQINQQSYPIGDLRQYLLFRNSEYTVYDLLPYLMEKDNKTIDTYLDSEAKDYNKKFDKAAFLKAYDEIQATLKKG